MANYNRNGENSNDLLSWLVIVITLVAFWPVGLVLLFRKLMGGGSSSKDKRKQQNRHPYDVRQEGHPYDVQQGYQGQKGGSGQVQPGTQGVYHGADEDGRRITPKGSRKTPPKGERRGNGLTMGRVNLGRGKGLVIGGAITSAVFGVTSLGIVADAIYYNNLGAELSGIFMMLGFAGAGLVMLYTGMQRNKKARRFRKYLALIGRRQDISIVSLAQAMPASVHAACDDLQEMLDTGILPTGYLDMGTGRLIFSEDGLREEPEPQPEPEELDLETEEDDAILNEIRRVNDAIADPVMSMKIDRVGEITGKIFAYQKQNPGRETQLRSFLSYYLPTTLKILRAYAQMEAQGIEGENIHAAKNRIEGMMDKVVEGFEKQLDKLFQNDAMDITTDVEVLERMLDKDGLSGGADGLRLGG